jgi:hypothetical protein
VKKIAPIRKRAPTRLSVKQKLMIAKPNEIELVIPIPSSNARSEKTISRYTWRNYHFEIGDNPDGDDYEQLFYNADLRSQMGLVIEWSPLHVVIWPRYYAGDLSNPNDYWTKIWRKLIKNSRIVRVSWGGKK